MLRYRDHRPEGGAGGHHGDRRGGAEKRRDHRALPDLRESQSPPDAGDHRPDRYHRRHAGGRAPAGGGTDGVPAICERPPAGGAQRRIRHQLHPDGLPQGGAGLRPHLCGLPDPGAEPAAGAGQVQAGHRGGASGSARLQPPPRLRRRGHGGVYAHPVF